MNVYEEIVHPTSLIPEIDLDSLSGDDLDALPIGVIVINSEGTISQYNKYESEFSGRDKVAVIGQNFFTDVAPCTRVPHFMGRFKAGLKVGALNEVFLFDFDFEMTPPVKVSVELRASQQPDRFYILTRVIEKLGARDGLLDASLFEPVAPVRNTREICVREPITTPGSIQPYGALLVVDLDTFLIVGESENVRSYLRLSKRGSLIGKTIFDFIDKDIIDSATPEQSVDGFGRFRERQTVTQFKGCDENLNLRTTRHSGFLNLELFIAGDLDSDVTASQDLLNHFDTILSAGTIEQTCSELARLASDISGFGRVLIYQFDEEFNGRTISETLTDKKMSSLINLRFPESDIPLQARTLYLSSIFRHSPNRDYTPVPVHIDSKASRAASDMRTLRIRSVSPIHQEYLKHMAVNGSASLSLIIDGKLWGLLILHDRKPRYLDLVQENSLKSLTALCCKQIETITASNKRRAERLFLQKHAVLIERVSGSDEIVDAVMPANEFGIETVFDCSGAACTTNGAVTKRGETPSDDTILALLGYAKSKAVNGIYYQRSIGKIGKRFQSCKKKASGALVLFPKETEDTALAWFFPEEVEIDYWAGNPYEKRVMAAGEETLVLPRKSFDRWTEVKTGIARKLTATELDFLIDIKGALQTFFARRSDRLARLSTELSAAHERLRTIVDNMAEGLIVLNSSLEVTGMNDTALELLKLGDLDTHGRQISEFLKEENTDVSEKFRAILKSRDVPDELLQNYGALIGKNGDIPVSYTIGVWSRHQSLGLVIVLRDYRREQRLERVINQRTKIEALGQFAGSVAHDFNNFLAIISANIQLASMLSNSADLEERLNECMHSVRRGSELTERLLSFVREEPDAFKTIDVNELLNANFDMLESILGTSNTLKISILDPDCFVRVPGGALINTFINLLTNARDAFDGPGTVEITVRQQTEDGKPTIRIDVQDNGKGMPDDVREKALEPFFTTKAPGKGTGLGLSSIAAAMKTAGGGLSIDSKVGEGTLISISLPLVDREPAGMEQDARAVDATRYGEAKTILLVEDDPELLKSLSMLVRQSGLICFCAASIGEAEAILADEPISVMLVDVDLGEDKSGIDLVSDVLGRDGVKRAVLMTGNPSEKTVDQASKLGVQLMVKPFTNEELQSVLNK